MKQQLFVDWSPDPSDHAVLLGLLANANLTRHGSGGYQPIAVVLRDPDNGEASGGIWGEILYGRLFVEILFVPESDRGHGLGSRLLTTLEEAAQGQGCTEAWLIVYQFQAPGFYEKNGYVRFAELGDSDNRLCFYQKAFKG